MDSQWVIVERMYYSARTGVDRPLETPEDPRDGSRDVEVPDLQMAGGIGEQDAQSAQDCSEFTVHNPCLCGMQHAL